MGPATRILFVDDEPNVLAGLRRMLRPMSAEWTMEFVASGEEALARLAQIPFDVVVSDMRMPGMDGAQLLRHVRRHYPNVVRIILSGHSEQEMVLKSIGPTHQYLAKPCDPALLRSTITRAVALSSLLAEPRIKRATSGMNFIPSMPTLFNELVEELQSPTASMQKIGAIIAKDPGMTAQILRLVNSAYFGLASEVSNPGMAVNLLGISTVTSLVLSVHVFQQVDERLAADLGLAALWRHSTATGILARTLARDHGEDKRMLDDAFTAGLVHDIGQLVLGVNFPEAYRRMLSDLEDSSLTLVEAEQRAFGATHAEVGAFLMGLWGLPSPIVEALAFHHSPERCLDRAFSPLTAVHVANALEGELSGRGTENGRCYLDRVYLEQVGVLGRLEDWRTLGAEALPTSAVRL